MVEREEGARRVCSNTKLYLLKKSCGFIFEWFSVIPKVKEGSLLSDEILADVQPGDTMVFSRGEAIALWVGVILFVAILSCVLYRLCRVTVQ